MPEFVVRYRSERRTRRLTAQEKRIQEKTGITLATGRVIGLAQLRTLELPGKNPVKEAKDWAKGINKDIRILEVTPVEKAV